MSRLFAVFLCLMIFFSCTRVKKNETGKKTPAAPAAVSTAVKNGNGNIQTEGNPNKIVLKRNFSPKTVQNSSPEGILKTLLPLKNGGNIYPRDFKIGKLEPELELSKTDRSILFTTKKFITGLQKGTIDKKTINPDDYDSLKKLSLYYFNKSYKFKSYRLSTINRTGENTVTVNCRLFGSPGTAEGQLYLKRTENGWFITDVQIDIKQITKTREKEVFVPNSYSWIMEE